MALTKVSIVLAAALALAQAAPAPQQVLSQPGGTILIPISRLSQTQIQGVPYIILPAGGAQSVAPGRFFLRTALPANAIAPPQIQATQTLVPVAVQPTVQREVQQTPILRVAQPVPAPAPAPAPAPVAPAQPVLVRQEIKSGQKVAVFRKPLDTKEESKEVFTPPQPYSFSYSINGQDTGDMKTASETSDGRVISGSYSLVEPDGTLRVVKYQADPVTGFTAVVERTANAFPAIPDPPRRKENELN